MKTVSPNLLADSDYNYQSSFTVLVAVVGDK